MRLRFFCTVSIFLCLIFPGQHIYAAEGGSGVYLLGLRSSGAGITPPPGVFFSNQTYHYSGALSGNVELSGGVLAAGVDTDVIVNIPTIAWITGTEIMGGRLGFSATTPFGHIAVDGFVNPFVASSGSVTTFGDPAVAGFLGWSSGNFHIQSGITGYFPIGDYRQGKLANLARHRLASDIYAAVTWLSPKWGLDISNTIGITLNAKNRATEYKTGTEFHWEGAITHQLTNRFSAGLVGYYYKQLTADKPPAAIAPLLGDYKGEIAGIGAQIGYNFNVGAVPVSSRLRYYHQFNATNHLRGDSIFFSLAMPLAVH